MSTRDLCSRAKIREIMHTPVNHGFTIYKSGSRGGGGSKLHEHVSMMYASGFFTFRRARLSIKL